MTKRVVKYDENSNTMYIWNMVINKTIINDIQTEMKKSSVFVHMQNVTCDDDECWRLLYLCFYKQKVIKLTMMSTKISRSHCIYFTSYLRDSSVIELALDNNDLDNETMENVLKVLIVLRRLCALSVTNPKIKYQTPPPAQQTRSIFSSVQFNPKLEYLDLSNNYLSDNDMTGLSSALASSNVKHLMLENVRMTDDGLKALCLHMPIMTLQTFDIAKNYSVTDITPFIQEMPKMKSLYKVDVSDTAIANPYALIVACYTHPTVHKLFMSNCSNVDTSVINNARMYHRDHDCFLEVLCLDGCAVESFVLNDIRDDHMQRMELNATNKLVTCQLIAFYAHHLPHAKNMEWKLSHLKD